MHIEHLLHVASWRKCLASGAGDTDIAQVKIKSFDQLPLWDAPVAPERDKHIALGHLHALWQDLIDERCHE